MRIGKADIHSIEETRTQVDMGLLCGDKAIIAKNETWLSPAFFDSASYTFTMIFQSWLVKQDDRTLLIDPCNGNGKTRQGMPLFNDLDTPYIERFEATGMRPEDVDMVFCTHLHCDHCGWNTKMRDGHWVPTFPNARYVFVQREINRWDPRRPGYRADALHAGVFEDSVLPILEAGLAELVPDTHQLAAGLSIEPAYGHTAGHSVLHLISDDQEAYFTGDAFHHPLQIVRPELHVPVCEDLEAAIATRRHLLEIIACRNAIILPAHFPAPYGGYIKRNEDGYHFEPLA